MTIEIETINEIGAAQWAQVLDIIRAELPPASFNTCFNNARVVSLEQSTLTIGAANRIVKTYIESNHLSLLQTALKTVLAREITVNVIVSAQLYREQLQKKETARENQPLVKKPLFANTTFANFVVGKGNEFAAAAAQRVTTNAGEYSPLFLFGKSGLGKTHLLHAICHEFSVKKLRVTCLSAENFVRNFAKATIDKRVSSFRDRFAESDLLAIDDLQILSEGSKLASQKEFAQILESTVQRGAQVVLTSTLPLNELDNLFPPLLSRLRQGLSAGLAMLDPHTRREIFVNNADDLFAETAPIADYLSVTLTGDVREIEGVIKTLRLRKSLQKTPLALVTVQEIVSNLSLDHTPSTLGERLPADLIFDAVSNVYNVSAEELRSKKRSQSIAKARRITAHLCRHLTGGSLTEIGKWLGGRNHATIISLLKKPPFNVDNALEKQKFSTVLARLHQTIKPDDFCQQTKPLFG